MKIINRNTSWPIDKTNDNDNQSQLLNMKDFHYILNEPNICHLKNGDIFLLIFVHSATYNFDKRQLIRNTWGNKQYCFGINDNSLNIRLVFMLGVTGDNDSNIQNRIENESRSFNDIIQGSFVDSYKNITYKHIMSFKWINKYCSNALYILKADDDIFIDTHQLIYYLRGKFGLQPHRLMACFLNKNSRVSRSYRNKWRVSFKEYPKQYYPSYCDGWAIIMSHDLVYDLYSLANNRPLFWIDDVYVSGILANDLNIIHYDFRQSIKCYKNDNVRNWLINSKYRTNDDKNFVHMMPPMFSLIDENYYHNFKDINETINELWRQTVNYYRTNLNISIDELKIN